MTGRRPLPQLPTGFSVLLRQGAGLPAPRHWSGGALAPAAGWREQPARSVRAWGQPAVFKSRTRACVGGQPGGGRLESRRSHVHRSDDNRHHVEEPFSARPSQRGGSLSITRSHYFPGSRHQLSLRRHPGVCTPCCGPRGSTAGPGGWDCFPSGLVSHGRGEKRKRKQRRKGGA